MEALEVQTARRSTYLDHERHSMLRALRENEKGLLRSTDMETFFAICTQSSSKETHRRNGVHETPGSI